MNTIYKYSFEVKWSPQDEVYIAFCREFPGLSAFGDTRSEAIEEGEKALGLFIEDYKEEEGKLPVPEVYDYDIGN